MLLDLPDVVLGTCLIQHDNHKISGPLTEVQLPARVFEVLQYLIQHQDRAVSRQELIQQIWSGNDAVGQKGLTNAIWQLRKAFEQAGAEQELILTIAKTGYELALKPQYASPEYLISQIKSVASPRRWIWWLLGLSMVVVIVILWFNRQQPAQIETALKPDIRPRQLTSMLGVEEMPSFSRDGRYMAFMADISGQAPGIFRLDLQQMNKAAEPLTPENQYATAPSWSPDQQQLAYLAVEGNDCQVQLLDLNSKQTETLANCFHQNLQNTLSWSASSNMLAFAAVNELGGVSIQGRDMSTGRMERLSSPRADTQDYPLAFANHSAQLAYVRQTKHLGMIYLRQSDGSSRALTKDPLYIYSLAWSPDDRFLYFNSVWQGELSILQISVQTGQITPLSYVKAPGRIAVRLGPQPELVYTQYNSEEQLYRIRVGQEPVLMPKTLGRELYPEYTAASDQLLFMSSRSGRFDLWHSDLAQTKVQRVHTTEEGLVDIASLAPDGEHFVVPARRSEKEVLQLYLGTLSGSDFKPASEKPFESQHASWSRDSRSLYFSSNISGDWQIWRLDLQSGISQQHTVKGGIFAREAPDGRLLYVKALTGGIWLQDQKGGEQLLVPQLAEVDWGNWLVDEKGIYYLQRLPEADLWMFKAWGQSTSVELFRVPGRSIKTSRSVTAVSEREFVVSMYGRREANLMAVPLIAQ
ncbi:winged helix-turn-helix domain-containing protein [Rheinheimera sp. MM224]|uniref:winged helix-turn-helix domain-containing protein n=1 Tax=Rheinheimera sp. MM224 TaxID=3019969 RepID=UPI0021F8F9EC|nr:winged helix-turn-helix domain-containing protein [Rheinheimera sp. MM224]CAI3790754.1 Tol-Pal system protein TolB [Rheinheimera sp. MM224]